MNVLVILAHPDPRSFNHAIAAGAVAALQSLGHQVVFHDLAAEGFDPVLPAAEIPERGPVPDDVALHCREVAAAEGIVVVHPNWWGQPPAVLKGWIDRVLRPGVAYRFVGGDGGGLVGLLGARRALVINTSNTPPEEEARLFGDPLETLWKNCVFAQCGVPEVHRAVFSVVCTSSREERRRWLDEVDELVHRHFPAAGGSPCAA